MFLTIESNASPAAATAGSFARLWQVMRSPLLLLVPSLLLLVLVGVGVGLPQIPETLDQDPAETTRWLLDAQGRYGQVGGLLAGLGLFDLMDSPVVRILLAVLSLLLLLQLGDLLVLQQRYHLLPRLLTAAGVLGEPLDIPGTLPVLRQRSGHTVSSSELKSLIAGWIRRPSIETGAENQGASPFRTDVFQTDVFQADAVVVLPRALLPEGADDPPIDRPVNLADPETADSPGRGADLGPVSRSREHVESATESRWLIRRHYWAIAARFAAVVGMLLVLAVAWLGVALGWQSQVRDLSPASRFQDALHDLQLGYELAGGGSGAEGLEQPRLTVQLGSLQRTLTVPERRSVRLGGAQIQIIPQEPALLVESLVSDTDNRESGSPEEPVAGLALPGGVPSERLSFVFPSVGSEESVLVPAAGVGLRLVRLEADRFLVEVISGEVGQPVERIEMTADETRLFELAAEGEQNPGETVWVRLQFAPSLSVYVRYLPGDWLLIPAIVLLLLGAISFVRRPEFLLVQAAPWPRDRSVVILQGDRQTLFVALRDWLDELDAAQDAELDGGEDSVEVQIDESGMDNQIEKGTVA